MKFNGRTNDNRKMETDWPAIERYVSRWKPNTYLEISIKPKAQIASNPQRGYYFAEVLPKLCFACGYEVDEEIYVHRQLKIIFFRVEPDERGIYREKDIPSVFSKESKLDKITRQNFIDWVIRKAAENGAEIEQP